MRIKDEHVAAFDWAVAHFADGRTADDFAQQAVDNMGANFAQSMAAECDAQLLAAVKANPEQLAAAKAAIPHPIAPPGKG